MPRTALAPGDLLPLTCTRSGTCCHGKDIRITPWELALLARAAGLPARNFRDRDTVDAGARLRVDGPPGWRGLPACSQYEKGVGCRVHAGRPMACRLFPLGRERQGDEVRIFHDGRAFPCLEGCPEVVHLPTVSVADYLERQGVGPFASVRDAYLDVALDLAEAALGLANDGGLAEDPDRRWLEAWGVAVHDGPTMWSRLLGSTWHDAVTVPDCAAVADDGGAWVREHAGRLSALAGTPEVEAVLAVRLFAAACLLLHAVGGDVPQVAGRWLQAVENKG